MTTKKSNTKKTSAAKPRSPRKKAKTKETGAKPTRKTAAMQRARKKAETAPEAKPTVAPTPKAAAAERREPTHQEIAARAREIWRESGGSAFENWIRAERELKK